MPLLDQGGGELWTQTIEMTQQIYSATSAEAAA